MLGLVGDGVRVGVRGFGLWYMSEVQSRCNPDV